VVEGLAVRELKSDEWHDAMTLAARAFAGEPFMTEIFGPEPIRRFEGAVGLYRSAFWDDAEMHLGTFVADLLVGLAVVSPPGTCRICTRVDPHHPPDDPYQAVDWEFEVNVQAAHSDQGEHAWLSKVVVDPALRGAGIGRALVGEALTRVGADGAAAMVLECQPHRERLYASCGFARVKTFPDPAGPPAVLMRADL
jgi:ribosomal protein S18 acetylase RimI-like enzyme